MYPIPKLDDFMRVLAELRELQNAYIYRTLGGNELYPDRTLVPEIKTAEYIRIVKMYMEIYLMCRKQFGEEMELYTANAQRAAGENAKVATEEKKEDITTENAEEHREKSAPRARHCARVARRSREECIHSDEANPLPPGQ